MHQVPLVTCILLCYTKITVNFCLPAEWLHTPCETPLSGFEVSNNVALMVTVYIVSFKVIGELQIKRLRQSRAAAFGWSG